jgi:hypothetical protein
MNFEAHSSSPSDGLKPLTHPFLTTMITENKRWPIMRIVVTVIAMGAIGIAYFGIQHQQQLDQVAIQSSRIGLSASDQGNQRVISRQGNPEIVYRALLKAAPIGEKLQLSCDWLDPNQQLVRQNHYKTLNITQPDWDTHCRYQLRPDSPTGSWTVRMALGGRVLGNAKFEVK